MIGLVGVDCARDRTVIHSLVEERVKGLLNNSALSENEVGNLGLIGSAEAQYIQVTIRSNDHFEFDRVTCRVSIVQSSRHDNVVLFEEGVLIAFGVIREKCSTVGVTLLDHNLAGERIKDNLGLRQGCQFSTYQPLLDRVGEVE